MTGRHFDGAVRSSSSPSTGSSHGHAADTEMDAPGPSSASGAENTRRTGEKRRESEPPPSQPPAKKKRTRTLTTPHQSAVLHALLAQSRFPTTAMREEVGRSIGLSARKVQVWFQNQRQKARRPRNQDSAPLMRPPQYGAYPNVLSLAPSTGGPTSFPHEGQTFYIAPPAPFIRFNTGQDSSSREEAIGSSVTGTRTSPIGHLSGPGVPGASSPLAPQFPPPSPLDSSHPAHQWQSLKEAHPGPAPSPAMPSREFTFSLPFPRLHVPEPSPQHTRFLPPSPLNQHPATPQRAPPPFVTPPRPRPHSPNPFLATTTTTPRAAGPPGGRIPKLHVPVTPQARRTLPYSPTRDARPALPFPPHSAERAVHSATSGSSRGGSPPVPVRPRSRRFDPVREAVSECSGSQGTDVSTPPRADTPHTF